MHLRLALHSLLLLLRLLHRGLQLIQLQLRLLSELVHLLAHGLRNLGSHLIHLAELLLPQLLQGLLSRILCQQSVVDLGHLLLEPSALLLLFFSGVAHLLPEHADALVVPVLHLHQGTLFLIDAVQAGARSSRREARHHLLRVGQGLGRLFQVIQLRADGGDDQGSRTATHAVPQQLREGGPLHLRRRAAVHRQTQRGQRAVDAQRLPASHVGRGLQHGLGAREVHQHQLAPGHLRRR
mmetsp:Transcript_22300/g.53122  ORF Transcript_22300/g.53122 Transcript_22300/m.53122 type:complete len:238 (+) Transcript_22300:831-1544(+)